MNARPLPPLWTSSFISLSIVSLLIFSGFTFLLSTLPVYIVGELGGNESHVGLVISVFSFAVVLIRPLAGVVTDRFNRRNVFLLGMLGFLVTMLLYYWANSIGLLFAVRMLQGIPFAIATTATGAIAADLIPAERRGEGMAYYSVTPPLGMALGPWIGLTVMNAHGFDAMILVASAMTLIALAAAFLVKAPSLHEPDRGPIRVRGIIEGSVVRLSSIYMFVALTFGGTLAYITLYAIEAGVANPGIFFPVYAVAVVLSRPFAGRLFDRHGPDVTILPGLFATAIGMFLLFQAWGTVGFALAAALIGVGLGVLMPTTLAMVIQRVPPERRGSANGTFFGAMDIGVGAGPLVLGWVASLTDYNTMFLVSALILAIPLAIYLNWERPTRRPRARSSA